ncbi:uncharacterized protein LOC105850279 isoform X1 [Hydra vulgaris]|uniref:uncharacterized protein LOC105850279 isoform X1 n=1 Tax=Hydra vulgaris TaxID=6087 RepID=UPI000640FCF7
MNNSCFDDGGQFFTELNKSLGIVLTEGNDIQNVNERELKRENERDARIENECELFLYEGQSHGVSALYNNSNDQIPSSTCCPENSGNTLIQDCSCNEILINKPCFPNFNNLAFSEEVNANLDPVKTELTEIKKSEEVQTLSNSKPTYVELVTNVDYLSTSESYCRKQLPTYLSLSSEFLFDEPPRYELVTGKQLKSQLEFLPSTSSATSIRQQTQQSRKRKLSIIIMVCLIIILGIIFFVLSKKLFSSNQNSGSSS